jgi:23S rRNA (adenine2503-C2)-methyltransferase
VAISLYDLTRPQLEAALAQWGFSPSHARPLWGYLYRRRVRSFGEMDELPARLRDRLSECASLPRLSEARIVDSADGQTRKFALGLSDGRSIETVRMQYEGRTTACLSSQVGCAVGCVFCATGQMGFRRNLSTGEIVAQALHVADESPLRNLVLMGMGEPLLNYDAVLRAVDIVRDPGGLAIGAKRITLSTVGVPHGIVRLADEGRALSLAVSLHAATQEERAALVPASKGWPLAELMDACRYYAERTGRRIFFEWTLIAGSNDSPEQAKTLCRLLHGVPAQVNLIPLNATSGFDGAAAERESVDRFRAILQDEGLPCSIRQYRGVDVAAGCGQLAGIGAD